MPSKSCLFTRCGGLPYKQEVTGSSPVPPTANFLLIAVFSLIVAMRSGRPVAWQRSRSTVESSRIGSAPTELPKGPARWSPPACAETAPSPRRSSPPSRRSSSIATPGPTVNSCAAKSSSTSRSSTTPSAGTRPWACSRPAGMKRDTRSNDQPSTTTTNPECPPNRGKSNHGRQAHPAPPRRSALLAHPLPRARNDARLMTRRRPPAALIDRQWGLCAAATALLPERCDLM